MDIPDILSIADVQRECGETDVALFNYGLEEAKPLRFFVIVPERGAFQVPRKALSHFQAGETEYLAHDLREHWNNDPLPEYLIRRDKLFVYADDWYRRMADAEELQQCMERIPVPLRLGFLPVEHIGTAIARAVLGIKEDQASAEPTPRLLHESAEWQSLMLRLANERKLILRNAQGLEFSGPFEESFLASAEIAAVRGLFELPPSPDRKYPRRISFEVYLPGHSLRSVVRSDGSVTTGWYEDEEEAAQVESTVQAGHLPTGRGAEESGDSRPHWRLVPKERTNDVRDAYYRLAQESLHKGNGAPPTASDCLRAWTAKPPMGVEVNASAKTVSYYPSKKDSPIVMTMSKLNSRIKTWVTWAGE